MTEIVVKPYDKNWPVLFKQEAYFIRRALAELEIKIHHIGSTSVEHLAAKPIIDILIEVDQLSDLDKNVRLLQELGYESLGEYGIPGRRYFRKGSKVRTHHIHAFIIGSEGALRHLAFKDYLAHHPHIAKEYEKVKIGAAIKSKENMELYCNFKSEFISEHERHAINWKNA